jgi:murein DD-endopeptidase MepM/ murein hydrolase activator NlpD
VKKGTFSIIIVPHDLQNPRTLKVPYLLFYILVGLIAASIVMAVVVLLSYGNLVILAQESSMYKQQVEELTKRTEKLGELRRNLAELRARNLQVRQMLGMEMSAEDSSAARRLAGEGGGEGGQLASEEKLALQALPSFWPVRGFVTRGFATAGGEASPQYHAGLDIAVDRGTPVRAAAPGYVAEAGWDNTYGYYVQIDHGYGIKTLYAHADMLLVMNGERVTRGQTIAYSGNTGRSTAPHLHFSVLLNNIPVDPMKYLLQ